MCSNKRFVLHLTTIAFFVVFIALIGTDFASAVLDDDNISTASAPVNIPTRKRGRPPGRRKVELSLFTDSEAPSEAPFEGAVIEHVRLPAFSASVRRRWRPVARH